MKQSTEADINSWFGIDTLEGSLAEQVEPNCPIEEPEEFAERLTKLIRTVTNGQATASWRFDGMSSVGPVYRLLLDGRVTRIRTRTGKPNFHKEVSDLVAELNGWDRNKLMWYKMGHASQLRYGYKYVNQCFDNMSIEDAVAAAVKFVGARQMGLC